MPAQRADRALETNGSELDGLALPHHGEERNDSVVRKVDLVDRVALLLEHRTLLQCHRLEVRREQSEIRCRQCRQQKITPVCVGAFELQFLPLSLFAPALETQRAVGPKA